jgi:Glutaredoxin
LLSSWSVPFEAVDVEARPAALAELERLGIPRVPAVVVGGRAVHGWNPAALAELVGVAYAEAGRLTPVELAQRLDRILAVAQRTIRQFPASGLGAKTPGRDRTVHQLGYHVFRLSLGLRDALAERRYPDAWIAEGPPAGLSDGESLAGYGGAVRRALAAWLSRPDACEGEVATYYGPQTAIDVFERTVWHAAQHVRQLHDMLERLGTPPEDPLTEADLAGLPLPKGLW